MKRVAVQFFRDCPAADESKAGIPGDWPAEVRALRDGDSAPPGWTPMTAAEYQSHRASLAPVVEAWHAARAAQRHADRAARVEAARAQRAALVSDLEAAERGWPSLSAPERQQAMRSAIRLALATAKRLAGIIPPESPDDPPP